MDCPHFKKRTRGSKLKVENFTVYYKTKKVKLKNKAVQKDYKKQVFIDTRKFRSSNLNNEEVHCLLENQEGQRK